MVGGVPIGGDTPVSIQSMTSTYTYDIVALPGDGIGPEVTDAACAVIAAAGRRGFLP